MEYQSDVAVLCVAGVNVVGFLLFVLLNPGTTKHCKKRNMIAGIALLSLLLVFDVKCLFGFVKNGMAENAVVFVLFIPILGYFLYDTIKQFKETTR